MAADKMVDTPVTSVFLDESLVIDEMKTVSNPSVLLHTPQCDSQNDINDYFINYIDESSTQLDSASPAMTAMIDAAEENSSQLEVSQLPDEVLLTAGS